MLCVLPGPTSSLSFLPPCVCVASLCSHRLLGLSTRLSLPVSLSLSIIHLIKGRDIDGGRGGGGASEGSDDRSEEEGEEGEERRTTYDAQERDFWRSRN